MAKTEFEKEIARNITKAYRLVKEILKEKGLIKHMEKQITIKVCDVCEKQLMDTDEKIDVNKYPPKKTEGNKILSPKKYHYDVCSQECLNKLDISKKKFKYIDLMIPTFNTPVSSSAELLASGSVIT